VVAHVAVSLDGATTGFAPDVGRFYDLARTWNEDVTLTGADTILAQEQALASAPRPGPVAGGPLLAVVDGRGRVRAWDALRDVGHWSAVLALYCAATPPRPAGHPVEELVTGVDRVDLGWALTELGRRDGVRTVRVDSGGALNGALLAAGLLDEVSLLVHPWLVGRPDQPRWYGPAAAPGGALDLISAESQDGGLLWLRYRIHGRTRT
jgi:2,5-diamino-6-(ribosylamino)-4(3H)-pyrimidinone 5'-phosphate reductase